MLKIAEPVDRLLPIESIAGVAIVNLPALAGLLAIPGQAFIKDLHR